MAFSVFPLNMSIFIAPPTMELQLCSLDCASDSRLLSWLCFPCCTSLSIQGTFPHFVPLLAGTTFEVMDHFVSAVSGSSLTSALMGWVSPGVIVFRGIMLPGFFPSPGFCCHSFLCLFGCLFCFHLRRLLLRTHSRDKCACL